MSRLVFNPNQMRAAALTLRETAAASQSTGGHVAGVSLSGLPPAIQGAVMAGTSSVAAQLRALSGELEQQALDLELRATYVDRNERFPLLFGLDRLRDPDRDDLLGTALGPPKPKESFHKTKADHKRDKEVREPGKKTTYADPDTEREDAAADKAKKEGKKPPKTPQGMRKKPKSGLHHEWKPTGAVKEDKEGLFQGEFLGGTVGGGIHGRMGPNQANIDADAEIRGTLLAGSFGDLNMRYGGAKAKAAAQARADIGGGASIGRDGVRVSEHVGAFVGVEGDVEGRVKHPSGMFSVGGTAGVSAGAGFEEDAEIAIGRKTRVRFKVGLTWGVGAKVGVDAEVDVVKVYKAAKKQAKKRFKNRLTSWW